VRPPPIPIWNLIYERLPKVSNIKTHGSWQGSTLIAMSKEIHILNAEKDGEDGLVVTFSDGTMCGYVVEELLLMRPIREKVKEPKAWNPRKNPATQN
jgi:hypothetical protein